LVYHPTAQTFVGDIWERLKEWYIDTGTLEIEITDKGKEKSTWIDQPNRFDPNVKAAHHLVSRLQKLYPKVKRGKRCNGHGIPLIGLRLADKFDLSLDPEGSDPKPPIVILNTPKYTFGEANSQPSNPFTAIDSAKSDPKPSNFDENFVQKNSAENQLPRPLAVGYGTCFARQPLADIASLMFRRRAAGNLPLLD
jgi:hypothetical protein